MRPGSGPAPRLSLGKYQLVRHLATGGMAEVLLARVRGIEGFERHVVIKKIRDERAREPRFVQMFLDEARLAASLHHHNIVHVHDIGQDDGEYFFTMEYVHGEDLRKLLAHMCDRERLVPLDHCITIALATAAALHHAHEHRGPDRKPAGIVHRDVSPANILVAYDGNVKVVDFGIAKIAQHVEETGLMKGKVAYMSPEQCRGEDVDRRSDIFCLGIVLYELVTVRRLFKGANDYQTMSSITHGVVPRPSELRPDVPLELEAIILKALAQEPADRYQTADEMRAALERFAATAKLQTSTTALADFMRAEFGAREVPWMEADEDDAEMSIDFDRSVVGVALAPEEPAADELALLPPPRTPSPTEPPLGTTTSASSSGELPAMRGPAVTARRRRLVLAGLGAAGLAGLAAIALAAGSSGGPAAKAAAPGGAAGIGAAPATAAAPAPAPAPAPAAATAPPGPITPPNLMPPAADPPLAASGTAPADTKPARPRHRPASKRPKGVWDPKALLPPK